MKEKIEDILLNEPGLKGREIAKKLGAERKTVNSFLSKNKDYFYQDDEYQWYLKTTTTDVEFLSGWIDADQFEQFLLISPDLFSVKGPVRFILPQGCNLLLESISRFLALLNQLDDEGIDVTVDLAECSSTRSFLGRAGFFDLLSDEVKILPERPKSSAAKIYKGNSDSLVEIGTICPNSKNKGLIVALRSNFVVNSDESFETVALTVFSEFINNVSDHSNSQLDGFAALQVYSPQRRRKHIQTVISDSGVGVVSTLRTTLKQHYPDLYNRFPDNDVDADIGLALEVFSKGNITRYGRESGRGLGFKSTREQASKFDADLSIRMDTFNIKLVYRGGKMEEPLISKGLTKIKGTHICFDFYVD
ncbi:hypothetical protein [Desulfuromonas acetoxidans]|uniref:hypothetical protein n=1 Tax=Desulfuromonas acetoxidans TaxID=891 RepID=UPI00292DB8B3|nr:hypothetical protein [Desulfuromonas acetoxidans]